MEVAGARSFIFLDDFHYVPRAEQPRLLDMLHGCVRDCDAWLKIASIRHQTRWFQSSPPMGLQTGHDADHIDLDVSLQSPTRAKRFLGDVLLAYATTVGATSLSRVFSNGAINRLVLASGAVPRDFLVLAAASIGVARERSNARLVGVQDVNTAAGDAAKTKLDELEDDLASDIGSAKRTIQALQVVRKFCLDEEQITYFKISFRDKERHSFEYALLANLVDVRLIHLIDPSLSDARHAGVRHEVFMLDLSQYSGQRLKQRLRVLDFVKDHIILRETRKKGVLTVGDNARKLNALLRRAPEFELQRLSTSARDES
jgi:hypothetical protein